MASANFDKASKSWRGHVCVEGKRSSKTGFSSKKKAESWANEKEVEFRKALAEHKLDKKDPKRLKDNTYTLDRLLERYEDEITPQKRGAKTEAKKLQFFRKEFTKLCRIKLIDLELDHFEKWKEARKRGNPATKRKAASDGTILRELAILTHAI